MFYHTTDLKRIPVWLLCCFFILLMGAGCSAGRQAAGDRSLQQKNFPGKTFFQSNKNTFQVRSTRSWIKLSWPTQSLAPGLRDYIVSWTDQSTGQRSSQSVKVSSNSFYIRQVQPARYYLISVAAKMHNSNREKTVFTKNVFTDTSWNHSSQKISQLDIPSSASVPEGMELFFHDEFNDSLLNHNKWFDTYYSTLDYDNRVQWDAFQKNQLPKAAYKLNGKYIDLIVNDSLPKVPFFKDGKKISSIQTYDWATNTNLLPNERGGYYEVRVRRNYTGHPSGLNTAFWFDSPGPDLRNYYQKGTNIKGVAGIRPKGQLFEIDMFENMNAQFVMHGHVDSNGHFVHNLATDIARGYKHKNNWVVHGLLWTPNAIKHYINGKLIHSYDDPHQIYSPDHFMNVFLGAYGKGGSVSLQVDYIRAYHWPVNKANELPNPGFELNDNLLPWQGTAVISKDIKISGQASAKINPGDSLYQYVYVSPDTYYQLEFAVQGPGALLAEISHVTAVTGALTTAALNSYSLDNGKSSSHHLSFTTPAAPKGHTRTIYMLFKNTGTLPLYLDDMTLKSTISR